MPLIDVRVQSTYASTVAKVVALARRFGVMGEGGGAGSVARLQRLSISNIVRQGKYGVNLPQWPHESGPSHDSDPHHEHSRAL